MLVIPNPGRGARMPAFLIPLVLSLLVNDPSVIASDGRALPVEPQDEVVAVSMRERGGRVMLERGKAGDTLRILDANDNVVLEKSTHRAGVGISAGGRHCVLQLRKEKSTEIEVLDANAKTTWRKSVPDRNADFFVSDAGHLLRTPGVEGGIFSVFDSQGNETAIEGTMGPLQPYEYAWSPNGQSLLIALDRGAAIMCIGPDAKMAYRLTLSYKVNLVSWGRAAVWDDCSAVIAVIPNSKAEPPEMLRIDSRGGIIKRAPANGELLIGAPAAISRDGTAFAFVEGGEILKVLKRDDFAELRSVRLPTKERVQRIVFGRDNDELAVVGAEESPLLMAGDPRVKSAGLPKEFHIRMVRRGQLHPKATSLLLNRPAALRFRPSFDLRSGALIFNEGRKAKRREASE